MLRYFLLMIPFVIAVAGFGQSSNDSMDISLNAYSSLRSHLAVLDKESELQGNASRIGFNLGVKHNNVTFFTHVELGITLIKNTVTFNADSQTASGFLIVDSDQEGQVFATRLGYLGVDLNRFGRFAIGKQWSTYYEIAGYTDKLNVFGGLGSNTYVASTDGGLGTGRVNQAFSYRNHIKNVNFGFQLLFRSVTNDQFIDGYGGYLEYKPWNNWSVGGSIQTTLFSEILKSNVIGWEDDPLYYCFGIKYLGEKLEFAAIFAQQTNGNLTDGFLTNEENPSVVFDAKGFEIYTKYSLERFKFIGGFNFSEPDTSDLPLNAKFKTIDYIFGLEYHINKFVFLYSELRLAKGNTQLGTPEIDVLTTGLRVDMNHLFQKSIGSPF